jgi:SAM-dependent methyltransferase
MDSWEDGDGYEPYMGRWSRPVAREFVDWLGVSPGSRWLDVGCGTGALISTIIDAASPKSVAGIDPSEGFLEATRRRTDDTTTLRVGDASDIPFATADFDVAVSGLVLNFVPNPLAAVKEMRRVAAGGRVAIYLWDYAGGMELIRYFWDAAVALDPGVQALDEAARFPLCAPEPMAHLFQEAGLSRVESRPITVPTEFVDFDDLWRPFLLAQGPAPSYVASLGEPDRNRLRNAMLDALPVDNDGAIRLTARAWAVTGDSV